MGKTSTLNKFLAQRVKMRPLSLSCACLVIQLKIGNFCDFSPQNHCLPTRLFIDISVT